MDIHRRDVIKGLGFGLCAAAPGMPLYAASAPRKYRIGHTGITWGYSPEVAPQAIADVGALGYQGFESFGSILEYWETRGGLQENLDAVGLPLIGAYCPMILTDADSREEEVAKVVRWGELIGSYGGSIAVIGPDNVDRSAFSFSDSRQVIVDSLNAMGQALADIGIKAALHQHTGSCITTRNELYAVMDLTDPEVVHLCPDTGEMLAAGISPVIAIGDYLERIAHVHIKDYNGGPRHDGFTAVGRGQVDVVRVIERLEEADHHFMIMAELNPDSSSNARDSRTPYQRAATSKRTFESLGYRFS